MPAWLPAAIAGAAALGSTFIGSRTQRKSTEKSAKTQMQLAEYQYSKDLEMWKRQNEYNSPTAQMQRFKEAGLNPHLIYSKGDAGQSVQMPKYNAPRIEYNYSPPVDPQSAVQAYQAFSQKSSQINYTQQQTETEFFKTWLTQTQQSNLLTEGQIKAVEYDYLMDTLQDRTSFQKAKLIYQNAENIINKKKAEWASQGMNPSDATWLRMTMELLRTFGVDPERIKSLTGGVNLKQ